MWGWPEPYVYTVYDRIFGDSPVKNAVCTPYIQGSGQPSCGEGACVLLSVSGTLCKPGKLPKSPVNW